MIQEGMKAYNFTLNDKNGKPVSLSDFIGQRLFFTFIPRTTLRDVPDRHVRSLSHIKSLKRWVL